jgi:hypothetical protein
MSQALAFEIGKALSRRSARRRAPILIRQIGQDVTAMQPEPSSSAVLSSGLVGVGAIAVVALFGVGLYLSYLRYKDGTKWEKITQIAAIVVTLIEIPAELAIAPAPLVVGLKVIGRGLDGYAAGHQISRGVHPIANGLSLVGDAWGLADAIAIVARGYGLGSGPASLERLPESGVT